MTKKENLVRFNDDSFFDRVQFKDPYYLREYHDYVSKFLRRLPVPVRASWDLTSNSLMLELGKKKNWFPVSSDIPVYEAGVLIDRWASRFYPQYKVEMGIERPLTEAEITIGVREGMFSLEEGFRKTKIVKKVEEGIITRIHLVQDEFKLVVGDTASIRLSTILLSDFLNELKYMNGEDEEIRSFIIRNSRLIKTMPVHSVSDIPISYMGNRMKNFFIVHKDYINTNGLQSVDGSELVYRSGKFVFTFESSYHRDSCIELLKQEDPKLIITDR